LTLKIVSESLENLISESFRNMSSRSHGKWFFER